MKPHPGRLLSLLLALALSLTACGAGPEPAASGGTETRPFTDSAGRTVELPREIARVASAGSLANLFLYALKPEALAGWSSAPARTAAGYIPEEYLALPEYGSFHGGSDSFNREALMASAPQVILDVGEWDEAYKAQLDDLQAQLGIPVILVEGGLYQTPAAFRTLGELLGEPERGEELAAYCEAVLRDAQEKAASIPPEERVRVYYGQDDGLSTILGGTIHAQIYELVGAEVAASAGGARVLQGGGAVSMEQLLTWDPDVILFASGGIFDAVGEDAVWGALSAIRSGRYYEIPGEPYSWLGRPPGPNRIVGVRWLGNLLYPEVFDYDIAEEVKTCFRLFYRYELTDGETEALLANSTLRAAERRPA